MAQNDRLAQKIVSTAASNRREVPAVCDTIGERFKPLSMELRLLFFSTTAVCMSRNARSAAHIFTLYNA